MEIAVIGGGAAGFFGAITCAESNLEVRVRLFERSGDVLSKVRVSGGGRCNVTHACFDPKILVENYPRGAQALRGPLSRFQPRDTVDWFAQRGVELKTEADGRMFPVTDQSSTIVDCLITAADRAKVKVETQSHLVDLKHSGSGFMLVFENGQTRSADRVLLATGSSREGYRWAEALGHTIVPPVPSLFTFQIADRRFGGLAGLSVSRARVELVAARLVQIGPVLITHWGLSGPAILKLSAWGARALHDAAYRMPLKINWLADLSAEELKAAFVKAKAGQPKKVVSGKSIFPTLPQRLWERFVESAGIPADRLWADFKKEEALKLGAVLQSSVYQIHGKGVFKEEFVTCGGVNLDEIHFKTMESKKCPGLYFAGEILDIDGVTGGFNFQNAWTTAYLAGKSLA